MPRHSGVWLLLLQALRKRAAEEGCEVVVVSAKVEAELNGMPPEEAAEWLEMLGVEAGEGGGLAALIRATYKTLGLQTYFTTGAWPVWLRASRAGSQPPARLGTLLLGGSACVQATVQHCPKPLLLVVPGRVLLWRR